MGNRLETGGCMKWLDYGVVSPYFAPHIDRILHHTLIDALILFWMGIFGWCILEPADGLQVAL